MRRLIFALMVVGFTCAVAYVPDRAIMETGLKTIVVETIDQEEPTCESIEAPPGSWGVGITNVNKVPGSVTVYDAEGNVVYNSGDYLKKESGMTIKVRGNTSARFAKKPYKIKLEKKGDLLGRGDKNFNDKNWVLLTSRGNLYEIGFIISKKLGMPWTPAFEYVNLVMNGQYRGLYTLAEAVERNEKCRIQTEETGMVIERDPYWWNENGEFLPSVWNPQFNWTLKYPDFEELTDSRTAYIQSVINDFEKVIHTEDYESLIDIDSFCRWLIAQDILGTSDGGGTNFYVAKDDDTDATKLYVPVLWDVDSGEETVDEWSAVHRESMIAPLFDNNNPDFKKKFIELYWDLSQGVFEEMDNYASRLKTDEFAGYDRAVALNNEVWGNDNKNKSGQDAADLDWWFPARKVWLDGRMRDLDATLKVDGIVSSSDDMCRVYSLDGQLIYEGPSDSFSPSRRGVYIIQTGLSTKKVIY